MRYSRGNTSGNGVAASGFQVLDDLHLELNEGPSAFDTRHNFVVSGQALVPHTGGLNVSWVARALSGAPFSLTNAQHRPRSQRHPGRAAGGGPVLRATARTRSRWRTTRASATAPTVPASSRLDARFGYRFSLPNRRRVEAFVDVFNLTNRTNFANPTGNQASTQFLLLTAYSTSYAPRKLQVGARIEF